MLIWDLLHPPWGRRRKGAASRAVLEQCWCQCLFLGFPGGFRCGTGSVPVGKAGQGRALGSVVPAAGSLQGSHGGWLALRHFQVRSLLQLTFLPLRMLAVSWSTALCFLGSPGAGAQWLECRNTENFFLLRLRPSNADYIALSIDTLQTWLE